MTSQFIDNAIFFFTDIYSKIIIKLVVALIILLLGFIVGKIIGKLLFKLLNELNVNEFFKKTTGINAKPDIIISKAITYLFDFFIIIIAFDAIAFTPKLMYILSGAIIVILVFSIIIGIKDIIPNTIAGLVILKRKDFNQGDKIQINEHLGKIDKISLTETKIKKKNGDFIYIPNSEILKNVIRKIK